MSLRQRERITRSYDSDNCAACGDSSYTHDLRRRRVAGHWRHVCCTCNRVLRDEGERGLRAFLRMRAYWGDLEADEVYADLR